MYSQNLYLNNNSITPSFNSVVSQELKPPDLKRDSYTITRVYNLLRASSIFQMTSLHEDFNTPE